MPAPTTPPHHVRDAMRTLLAVAGLAVLPGCAADREVRAADDAPVSGLAENDTSVQCVSRSGIPILMDLPIIGFLFGRRVEVRGGTRESAAIQHR
ncbi:MAG: hypothetical protein AAF628_24370 [Planctomycetota bacterium]